MCTRPRSLLGFALWGCVHIVNPRLLLHGQCFPSSGSHKCVVDTALSGLESHHEKVISLLILFHSRLGHEESLHLGLLCY